MNTIKIIEKISNNSELADRIINHFERNFKVKTSFQKFCNKNYIDVCPSLLFYFFDTINIKIAIMPMLNTDMWSCRIFTDKRIMISEHYSRKDAELEGLNKAIDLYINGYEI